MLIREKIGHINSFAINDRIIDLLLLEWYEARKRILVKHSNSGKEVSLKFLNENPEWSEGDILFADDNSIIVVSILPCRCIVLQPKNMFEMASICYEIGNKHLSLFYDQDQLLVPFELPLYNLLQMQGYEVKEDNRKLLHLLKTTVTAHVVLSDEIIFSKTRKLNNEIS
jgi:urease accessory protein